MRVGNSPPLSNPADLRFRVGTVRAGCWLTLGIASAGLLYELQTWSAGNRSTILAITLGAIVLAATGLTIVPIERIVASRWREEFFMTWSFWMIGLLLVLGALDPLPHSPLTLPLFMPLLFAGMSYPFRTASIAAAAVLGGYLLLCLVDGESLYYGAFVLSCLGWTAFMCLWQARLRDTQRRELEQHRDQLAIASRVDPLTGALNRRGFDERLGAELAEASRAARPLTLVVLDIDHFKEVNDRGGHAVGDELLVRLVELVTDTVRPMDAVARLGGDEFAIVLPGTSDADSQLVLERVRDALDGHVEVSLGHGCFPADGVSADELLRSADTELYAAKRARPRGRATSVDLSWATALADAVDRRMGAEHSHSVTVATYAALIAQRLGWKEEVIGRLRLAATLHDIGKVAVPDRILQKPGPLTAAEFDVIRTHPVVGAQIVARVEGLDPIAEWIERSHEHYDGSGYPDGLAGDAIPAAARILLVADAFDAMTSDRVYRRAISHEYALAELERHAGTQFDADCVAAMAEIVRVGASTAPR